MRAGLWRVYRLSRMGRETELGRIIASPDRLPALRDREAVFNAPNDPAPPACDRVKTFEYSFVDA